MSRQFAVKVSLLILTIFFPSVVYCLAPKDPPVTSGGEGATGNDWVDFWSFATITLPCKDVNGNYYNVLVGIMSIETSNPNFVLASNRTDSGTKVRHFCFSGDYGDDFGLSAPQECSVADGNRFWDEYYSGYTPAVSGSGSSTDKTNCVSYAYDGYKGAAASKNWTNSGTDASPFFTELTLTTYAVNGTRCNNSDHVWILESVNGSCLGTTLKWKNNVSRYYTWSPSTPTNDGPKGGGTFYTSYNMYKK